MVRSSFIFNRKVILPDLTLYFFSQQVVTEVRGSTKYFRVNLIFIVEVKGGRPIRTSGFSRKSRDSTDQWKNAADTRRVDIPTTTKKNSKFRGQVSKPVLDFFLLLFSNLMPRQGSVFEFKTAATARGIRQDFKILTRQSDLHCSNGSDNGGSVRLDGQKREAIFLNSRYCFRLRLRM